MADTPVSPVLPGPSGPAGASSPTSQEHLPRKGLVGALSSLVRRPPKKPMPQPDTAHAVAQAMQGQQPSAPQQPVSMGHPEVGPIGNHFEIGMPSEIEVIPETPEVSAELAEHVEAVEQGEVKLPEPMPVAPPTSPQVVTAVRAAPSIVLPVTQNDMAQGAKQPITSSWRWLIEWVTWIIKKNPGRVLYRT